MVIYRPQGRGNNVFSTLESGYHVISIEQMISSIYITCRNKKFKKTLLCSAHLSGNNINWERYL